MKWLESLRRMKKSAGMTTKEIADASGIPEPTLEKLFAGGTKDPRVSTMRQLVHCLGASLDDIYGEENKNVVAPLSVEARETARRIERLDERGKKTVEALLSFEEGREKTAKADAPRPQKVIPLFATSFAAGNGEPDFGNLFEDYTVDAESKADFAIRITGDSMEPHLHDGDIALGVRRTPEDGEIAALYVDGLARVKQICRDAFGNLYLFALNRDRSDTDDTIWADSERDVCGVGTIIMPQKRYPLP